MVSYTRLACVALRSRAVPDSPQNELVLLSKGSHISFQNRFEPFWGRLGIHMAFREHLLLFVTLASHVWPSVPEPSPIFPQTCYNELALLSKESHISYQNRAWAVLGSTWDPYGIS